MSRLELEYFRKSRKNLKRVGKKRTKIRKLACLKCGIAKERWNHEIGTKIKCKTFKSEEIERSRSKSDKFPFENVRVAHSPLKRSKTRSSQIAMQRLGSLSCIQNIVFVDAKSRTRNQFIDVIQCTTSAFGDTKSGTKLCNNAIWVCGENWRFEWVIRGGFFGCCYTETKMCFCPWC